jgi:hypothetical protein
MILFQHDSRACIFTAHEKCPSLEVAFKSVVLLFSANETKVDRGIEFYGPPAEQRHLNNLCERLLRTKLSPLFFLINKFIFL